MRMDFYNLIAAFAIVMAGVLIAGAAIRAFK